MKKLSVSSRQREQIIDITAQVKEFVSQAGAPGGIVTVYSPHTTAAITVNENADPDVKSDMSRFLNHLVPRDAGFDHAEGNADSHIKGTVTGFSQTFIVENSRLQLGTWQGIFLMEFDGPRQREVWLQFVPSQ